MQYSLKRYVEPFAEIYERLNPENYNISWVDSQALIRKKATSVLVADLNKPQNSMVQYVVECVDEVAQKMQTYPSKIIIYDNDKSNAMHINNSLAISIDKIHNSTPEQLKASIAHELSHQQNNNLSSGLKIADIGVEMASGFVVGTLACKTLTEKNYNPIIANIGGFIAGSVAGFIASNITKPIYAAFRRDQEFIADEVSAKINGAEAMIEVLQANHNPNKEQSWTDKIYSNHPSHAERIAALQKIASETQPNSGRY
jgi:Zn-dependent protease with chaperone function